MPSTACSRPRRRTSSPPAHLLGLCPPAVVDDLLALTTRTRTALEPLSRSGAAVVHAAPVFAGSADVDGADGDLVVDTTLLELKTTKSPDMTKRNVQQLACYALLDYPDTYALTSVAYYNPRHGPVLTVPLEELLTTLAGHPVRMAELRVDHPRLPAAPAARGRRPLRAGARRRHRPGGSRVVRRPGATTIRGARGTTRAGGRARFPWGKALISLSATWVGVGPYLFDWNETHTYNPEWTPHAKFYNAQTMSLGAGLRPGAPRERGRDGPGSGDRAQPRPTPDVPRSRTA